MTSGTARNDSVAALTEVADVVEVAAAQQRVAHQARGAAKARREGASWSRLVGSSAFRSLALLHPLGEGATTLFRAAGALRLAAARAFVGECWTTRQIGERFGISHQREASLL